MKTFLLFFIIPFVPALILTSFFLNTKGTKNKIKPQQAVDSAGISGIRKENKTLQIFWLNQVNSPWSQESYLSDFTKPGC
jgi:hypothetical protein